MAYSSRNRCHQLFERLFLSRSSPEDWHHSSWKLRWTSHATADCRNSLCPLTCRQASHPFAVRSCPNACSCGRIASADWWPVVRLRPEAHLHHPLTSKREVVNTAVIEHNSFPFHSPRMHASVVVKKRCQHDLPVLLPTPVRGQQDRPFDLSLHFMVAYRSLKSQPELGTVVQHVKSPEHTGQAKQLCCWLTESETQTGSRHPYTQTHIHMHICIHTHTMTWCVYGLFIC